MSACLADQTSKVFLSRSENPKWFQQGDISVTLLGGTLPASYSYSYLHNLNRETPIQNRERREAHAGEIRKTLNQLYGRPIARGRFEEYSEFGFIVSKQSNQPCGFWLIDKVGILLCAERVIYLDGFEMSLSFTRLDRIENSDAFLAILAHTQGSGAANFNTGFARDAPTKLSVSAK